MLLMPSPSHSEKFMSRLWSVMIAGLDVRASLLSGRAVEWSDSSDTVSVPFWFLVLRICS